MRFFLGVVAALVVVWTGWWFFAAGRIENGAGAFLADPGAGRGITYESLNVNGFPYRFALDLGGVEVTDTAAELAWTLPHMNVTALAYRPNHLIATFPPTQALVLGDRRFDIAAGRMQASLRTLFAPDLPLDRATVEADGLRIRSDGGGGVEVAELLLASRRSEVPDAPPHSHDVVLTASGLRPDPALRAGIDPGARLPEEIGPVRLDATVTLDAPLDRRALQPEMRRPELLALDIRNATVTWGASALDLSGVLDFDGEGLAQGTLEVEIAGWQGVLDLAISAGLVPEAQRRMVEQAMRLMESTRFGAKDLRLTLPVQAGVARIGPIPVARLPSAVRIEPRL